ncbi:MAG: hypothetical protein KF850_31515 [Labilithrix sp.]|nr:hypothetical protein [Labilithrix sp.]
MKNRLLSLVLSATAVVACSSASSSGEPAVGDDAHLDEPGEDVIDDPGAEPGGPGDPGTPAVPGLSSASFRNIGRRGEDIVIHVAGTDAAMRTSAAHVRFTDDADAPVKALDSDWDGVADAAESTFRFDVSTLGSATFEGTITIPSAFGPTSKVKKAFVALEDEAGARSAEIAATMTFQALKIDNEPCDPQQIESRCEAGLACGGTPAICQPGSAPAITKAAYIGGASPKMVFRGEEPDEDIASISVEFLDSSNQPKTVVLTGEGQDGTSGSSVVIDAEGSAFGTTFFVEAFPAPSFVSQVPRIAATAADRVGRTSTRLITPLTTLPARSTGQVCDPDGFDACSSSAVCFPGIRSERNTCRAAASTRTQKCKDAPGLDPAKGVTRAYGAVSGVSLWDAPTGCVPNDATGRPEAAVQLHLAAPAPTLRITTALPETSFDTAVYLIPSCAASSAAALGCNDDAKGYASELVLQNVPAGDYTIVVESVQRRGGRFGVAVSTE